MTGTRSHTGYLWFAGSSQITDILVATDLTQAVLLYSVVQNYTGLQSSHSLPQNRLHEALKCPTVKIVNIFF